MILQVGSLVWAQLNFSADLDRVQLILALPTYASSISCHVDWGLVHLKWPNWDGLFLLRWSLILQQDSKNLFTCQ